jgi:hypothetical protein
VRRREARARAPRGARAAALLAKNELAAHFLRYRTRLFARARRRTMPAAAAENIQIAAADGDLPAVQEFVLSGVKPDSGDFAGHTALHAAASYGHEAVLSWLLAQAGHEGAAAVDADGDTPLHVCESAPCATLLLEAAARAAPSAFDALAATNGAGETPYVVAVRERRAAVADVLRAAYAARGAEPPAVDVSLVDGEEEDDEEDEDADEAEVLAALAAQQAQQD